MISIKINQIGLPQLNVLSGIALKVKILNWLNLIKIVFNLIMNM